MLSQFVFVLKIKNQKSFYPFILQEVSVLFELFLGHLRSFITDVPPQPNSQPDNVERKGQSKRKHLNLKRLEITLLPRLSFLTLLVE